MYYYYNGKMNNFRFIKTLKESRSALFAGFFAFLLVSAGDVHSHLCLDGQEPPVSVHFENLGGHPEHGDESGKDLHDDYEFELASAVLQLKYKQDLQPDLIALLADSFEHLSSSCSSLFIRVDSADACKAAVGLPPARAPPVPA